MQNLSTPRQAYDDFSLGSHQGERLSGVPDQVPHLHRHRAAAHGPVGCLDVQEVPPPRLRAGHHHETKLSSVPFSRQRINQIESLRATALTYCVRAASDNDRAGLSDGIRSKDTATVLIKCQVTHNK